MGSEKNIKQFESLFILAAKLVVLGISVGRMDQSIVSFLWECNPPDAADEP